ncbi:phenylacetate--CoA ligase family protein [Nocardioides taihuensis]|uniref:Phenylacetate--CoA ligase family protein n=1 Tax=Nocardioides taihuensis TaxID=1835606 RepID=A0ABW0BFS2_9ACTN
MTGEVPDLDRGELEALQLERLRATVRHAARVPHYRRALGDAGVTADDIGSLDDVRRLPFTTKADLRDNYPFGMFAVPREQVARVHASSGTTGKPTVVGYTADDLATWSELMARSIRAAGGRRATSSTSRTATASSPAGSAPTTAPSTSAARSCRSAAA